LIVTKLTFNHHWLSLSYLFYLSCKGDV
jgi:hypothetical protein